MSKSEPWFPSPNACRIFNTGTRSETGTETDKSKQREVLVAPSTESFIPEQSSFEWESGLDSRHVAFITDNDISWLFDDASFDHFGSSSSLSYSAKHAESLNFTKPDPHYLETVDLEHNNVESSIESTKQQVEAP